jgi:hypothetical protein
MGSGFSFVARQKRMVIDGEDHTLELLFYHRRLRRLVAVELNLGKFKAAYKGQMELYLRWLEEQEREPNEESPLGLILCAEGGQEIIAVLRLDQTGIHVRQYLTELPPKEVLERNLHESIALSEPCWRNGLIGKGRSNLRRQRTRSDSFGLRPSGDHCSSAVVLHPESKRILYPVCRSSVLTHDQPPLRLCLGKDKSMECHHL